MSCVLLQQCFMRLTARKDVLAGIAFAGCSRGLVGDAIHAGTRRDQQSKLRWLFTGYVSKKPGDTQTLPSRTQGIGSALKLDVGQW